MLPVAVFVALLTASPLTAQTRPKPCLTTGIEQPASAILIGNSFFYYNNSLHNHRAALLLAAPPGSAAETRERSAESAVRRR